MATAAPLDPIDPRLFATIREIAEASTADPVEREQLVERMCRPTPGRAALERLADTRFPAASNGDLPSAHLNEAGCAPTCGLSVLADYAMAAVVAFIIGFLVVTL